MNVFLQNINSLFTKHFEVLRLKEIFKSIQILLKI